MIELTTRDDYTVYIRANEIEAIRGWFEYSSIYLTSGKSFEVQESPTEVYLKIKEVLSGK